MIPEDAGGALLFFRDLATIIAIVGRLFLRLGVLNRLLVLCQLSLICLPLVTYDASTPATVVGFDAANPIK